MPKTTNRLFFKTILIVLLALAGDFVPISAQNNADGPANKKIHNILIKVRAADLEKISGAVVILYDKTDMHVIETRKTPDNGNVSFTVPTFHDYIIAVVKKGYLTKKIWINSQPLGKENKSSLEYDNDIIMKIYNSLTDDVSGELMDKPSMKLAYLPKGPVGPNDNPFDYDQNYESAIKKEAKKMDPQARQNAFDALIVGKPIPATTNNSLDLTYKDAMSLGDKALASKDYLKARDAYNKALDAKPGDKKASDQLVIVDKALGINAYQELVKKADQLFIDKEYPEAKKDYQECLAMKPKEKWPKEQLEKIIRAYTDAVNKADDLVIKKKLKEAKDAYKEALAISPNEQYPKDKIKEINKKLKESGGDKDAEDYETNKANADKAYLDKNYAYAKYYYSKASKQKPTEKYPKDQLVKVNAAMNTAAYKKTLDGKYNEDMKKGKEAMDNKDYDAAKSAYKDASILKPEQKMPPVQLAKIDHLIKAAQLELEANYQAAIDLGDKEFKQKHLDQAKVAYSTALTLKAEETYPKDKLAEIDLLLQKKSSDPYQDAIAKADKAFDKKDYKNARLSYVEAGGLKPDEQYPKDRIAAIDKLLAEMVSNIEKLNPGGHKEILDAQILQQMQEKHDELVEKSKQLQLLRKAYVKRMANLSTKYDTENPLTRLLDIVDSKPTLMPQKNTVAPKKESK